MDPETVPASPRLDTVPEAEPFVAIRRETVATSPGKGVPPGTDVNDPSNVSRETPDPPHPKAQSKANSKSLFIALHFTTVFR